MFLEEIAKNEVSTAGTKTGDNPGAKAVFLV
jgi:hypothetical protein